MNIFDINKNRKGSIGELNIIKDKKDKVEPHQAPLRKIQVNLIVKSSLRFREKYLNKILDPVIINIITTVNVKLP